MKYTDIMGMVGQTPHLRVRSAETPAARTARCGVCPTMLMMSVYFIRRSVHSSARGVKRHEDKRDHFRVTC